MAEIARTRFRLEKRCIACGETKSASAFYVYAYVTNQKKQSHRLDSRCKECAKRRTTNCRTKDRQRALRLLREWRSTHVTHRAAYSRAYRDSEAGKQSHRKGERLRKIRKKCSTVVHQVDVDLVFEMAKVGNRYLDAYTGDLITDPSLDHIIPLSKGGSHSFDNLCITSKSNNSRKNAKPMIVWLVEQRDYA